MWQVFQQSHQNITMAIINQVKGRVNLSAEEIERVNTEVLGRLTALTENGR